MTEDNWVNTRERIRSREFVVSAAGLYDTGIPGLFAILATIQDLPMPIGILWWRVRDKDTLEILDVYVKQEVRRAGVFRTMLDFLAECGKELGAPRIWTWEGSPYGGRKAIKALGFKKAERGWLLRAPRRKC